MKLKKIIAALLAAAVTAASCVQAYAVNVPLTEGSPGAGEITTSGEPNSNSDPNQGDGESSESWEANFVYDESTGILTWDEYTGVENTAHLEYSFEINGEIVHGFSFENSKPYVHLPLYFAYWNLADKKNFAGDYEIKLSIYINGKRIYSSDSFSYTFNGGNINENLTVPILTKHEISFENDETANFFNVNIQFKEEISSPGFFYKIYSDNYIEYSCQPVLSPVVGVGGTYDNTKGTITKDSNVYVAVCAVDINGNLSEWSEPYLLTAPAEPDPNVPESSWNANFSYDEETGILSWDDIIGSDEELRYQIDFFAPEYAESVHEESINEGYLESISGDGWGDMRLGVPNINLPLCLAVMSYHIPDLFGEIRLKLYCTNGYEVVYSSSDSFVYNYDGRDVNTELKVPSLKVNGINVTWDAIEGAVGYLYSSDRETVFGFNNLPDSVNEFTLSDEVSSIAVCAVDKNGDVSEWSEIVSASSENPDTSGAWKGNFFMAGWYLSWDRCADTDGTEGIWYDIITEDDIVVGRTYDGEWNEGKVRFCPQTGFAAYNEDHEDKLIGTFKLKSRTLLPSGEYAYTDDSYTYTYEGTAHDSDLIVPGITGVDLTGRAEWNNDYYNVTLSIENECDCVGFLLKFDSDEETFGANIHYWTPEISVNWIYLPNPDAAVKICAVYLDGSTSEWSEPFKFKVAPKQPDPSVPDGYWKADFSYDESSGYLHWDKAVSALTDPEIGSIAYSVIINDDIEFSVTDYDPKSWGGSLNFWLAPELALYNVTHDNTLSGNLTIKVRLDTPISFIKEPVCVDSFTYAFGGKEDAEDIRVPEITDVETDITDLAYRAYNVHIKTDRIENAVGYLIKFGNGITSVSEYWDWDNGIINWWYVNTVGGKDTVQVCAVDVNGNAGKWSEPFEFELPELPMWKANFAYDEESGALTWDGCPYFESEAEQSVEYHLYAEDTNGNITFIGNVWSFKQPDDTFSNQPIYPGRNFLYNKADKGTYKLYLAVVGRDNVYYGATYISSDKYTYVFKGGELAPDLKAPLLQNAVAYIDGGWCDFVGTLVTHNGQAFAGSVVQVQFLSDGKNMPEVTYGTSSDAVAFTITHTGDFGISVSGAKELSAKLRLIDKDGFYSEWSEPYLFGLKVSATDENGYYNKIFDPYFKCGLTIATGSDGKLGCNQMQDIRLPGVVYKETTAGELKKLLKGMTVTGFELVDAAINGKPADITMDDLFYGVVIQSIDKDGNWGWNAKYSDFTMDFDTDLTVDDGDKIGNALFQYGLTEEAIERLGLKAGDYVYLHFNDKLTETVGENSFTYVDNGNGVTITGGTIKNPNVTIPAEIDGKPVTEIGMNAFAFNSNIETLAIPENVKRIGWYAFNTCENLTEVTLPESLEYIDNWAFERCSSLKTVTVPKNTSHVGSGAFAQNTSMTSINCDPANGAYVSVDGVLFTKDMKELTAYPCGRSGSYTVPESVNHIGNAAFYGAKKLSAVEISGTLDFIGFEAFAECELLNNVNINDGVNYVGYWAFRGCTGIKQLTVPQSVTNIGDQAFGFRYADNKYDDFSLRGYKDSSIYYYAVRHDIPFVIIGDADKENSPFKEENAVEEPVAADPSKAVEDSITSITINPAFNMKNKNEAGVGIDLTKIKIKAEEIYQDEESIRRAEEALGDVIKGNKHYNLLDLTLLYDGEDFSDGYDGLVEVIIPIPAGHRDKEFYCYRIVDNNGTPEKELIPGKRVEDSYIIYLEHFSTYAFVGDGDHEHSFGKNWESDGVNHWHECSCGEISDMAAHTASEPITENGVKYTECTVCGRILSKENVSGTDTPETPSNPAAGSGSGTFVSPDTTTESAAAETTAPSPETTAPQASADNTDTTSDGTSQGSDSDNSAAPSDNNTDGNADENADINTGSTAGTENGAANEDKNQNTGVTLAVIPVLAAAAGIIFSKKRK